MPTRDGMYATVTVRVNRLPEIRGRFVFEVEAAQGKAVLDTEAGMKVRAPIDTGFLANNIGSNGKDKAWSAAEYSVFVNYGTRFQPAQPFVEPAIEDVLPGYLGALRQLVDRL